VHAGLLAGLIARFTILRLAGQPCLGSLGSLGQRLCGIGGGGGVGLQRLPLRLGGLLCGLGGSLLRLALTLPLLGLTLALFRLALASLGLARFRLTGFGMSCFGLASFGLARLGSVGLGLRGIGLGLRLIRIAAEGLIGLG
jgi:hypothetical protein